MKETKNDCRAVSEVVGEMLMIGIVLILAAVFSSQLPNYLPSDRSPSVTLMMSTNTSVGSVTLWHKGGDWIKISSVRLIVSNQTTQSVYTYTGERVFTLVPDPSEPGSTVFDLGGNITAVTGSPFGGDESVVLATDRAVLFSGKVGSGQS